MPETLNIYQKLAKIRKPVEVLKKNKSGFNYKYVTEDLILAKITGLMGSLGVSLIPHIVPKTTVVTPYHYTKTKVLKDGKVISEEINEILVSADMEWHWINNENPEDRIIVPWTLVGQQSDASQALGSGLSYSSRYFMLKYFNVATSEDDPDHWRQLQEEAANSENKEVVAEILNQVHSILGTYIEKHPDSKAEIASVVKQFAKGKNGKPSADYFNITDPKTASELLNKVTEKYSVQ